MKQRFAVLGLGNFGSQIARALYHEGHEVLGIDRDARVVQVLKDYCTEAVVLDAGDKENLSSFGMEAFDCAIVAMGGSISQSILATLFLQELGVKRIIAKAQDDTHERILTRVGATQVIQPERDSANRLARHLSRPNIMDFIPLEGDFDLVQVEAPQSFVGKTLRELDLQNRYHVAVIAVRQGGGDDFDLGPRGSYRIAEDQTLIMLGRSEDIDNIRGL